MGDFTLVIVNTQQIVGVARLQRVGVEVLFNELDVLHICFLAHDLTAAGAIESRNNRVSLQDPPELRKVRDWCLHLEPNVCKPSSRLLFAPGLGF